MATINLRDYYPFSKYDVLVDVPDDLAEQLEQWERDERAYQRRRHWHRAHYSLDRSPGIEKCILYVSDSPDKHYEKRLTHEQLRTALSKLPDKQGRRIYAYCVLGFSNAEIARTEGIGRERVRKSIARGLKKLRGKLENM